MAGDTTRPTSRAAGLLPRAEDWLLTGWIAIASPLIYRVTGSAGPFDPHQPAEGIVRLVSVFAALLCVAGRRQLQAGAPPERSIAQRAAVGPLTGGVLLVAIGGFTALDMPQNAILAVIATAAVLLIGFRFVGPPLATTARRALVSPFILVTGGIFWSLIEAVTGEATSGGTHGLPAIDLVSAPPAALFLLAFSAVYYAMLVYAPRQMAEAEGGPVAWGLRYAAFVASVVFGVGWLRLVGA